MINSPSKFWPWFFFAAAFESLAAMLGLLLVPSEGGLSLARVALLAILLSFFVLGIYLGIVTRRDLTRFDKFARAPIIFSCALLFLTSSLLLFLLRYLNPERLLPYYERLSPLLWYFLAIGIQAVLFLLLIKKGFNAQGFFKRKPIYISALFSFSLLLSILLFIAITKIGVTPDTGYWGEPGVAMLGWQFVVAILAGFITLLTASKITNYELRITIFIIPLALYIIALILWLSVRLDVLASSFYAPISPPANIPFPYSDAGFYDYLSQSLLIGTDYFGGIPPRPLYVVFLALLHLIFGQNYPAIIAAQTFVLAFFPLALYFLAKKLHSPAAGVTVALFAIFRELVGLWISSNTRVANSKMFTTDFPTAMGIALMCLVAIWWLERRDFKSTLVAGGAFGLLSLFRTQSLLILPVLFVLAWFAYQRKTKEWIMAGTVFALMMALTVLPWLTHNYTIAGQFSFDDPKQVAIIYSQYSFTGNLDLSQFDPQKESAGQRILSFTLENPAYVAKFITAHFLNTEIGGLLALPLIKGFDGLLAPVNLYWVSWDGSLEWYNLALVIIYLGVLAVGFGAAWHRLKWIGLVPLAFNLGFALANGISRFSSWRYNLPVDWVIYFYFAIGAVEILGGLALLLGAKPTILESATQEPAILESDSSLSAKKYKFRFKYV
ncbi:MAG: glycosyltransferase family 39 protein, partial [Anaerolineales bacterium]|nr:glycosyltransferase family 39 protein [Anaerolineales bacterium]